jgi:hypothetical protein
MTKMSSRLQLAAMVVCGVLACFTGVWTTVSLVRLVPPPAGIFDLGEVRASEGARMVVRDGALELLTPGEGHVGATLTMDEALQLIASQGQGATLTTTRPLIQVIDSWLFLACLLAFVCVFILLDRARAGSKAPHTETWA